MLRNRAKNTGFFGPPRLSYASSFQRARYLLRWKIYGPPKQEREFKGQNKWWYLFRPGTSYVAAFAYLAPLLTIDYLIPRRRLPVEAPTAAGLIAGVASSVWLYDLIFFFVHLVLHKVPFLYRNVHQKHHTQATLTSVEVIHHSFIDGTLQVYTYLQYSPY